MKQKTTKSISMFFIYSILILWAITTIFPFIWVFVNSFKTSSEILNNSFSLPASPTFQNYINAFEYTVNSMESLAKYLFNRK